MNKVFSLIIVLVCLVSSVKAQTVYSVSSQYDSQVKVYVADSKYDADLVVFKCSSSYDADGNKGLWFFTDSRYDAKKAIYFTDSRYDADLVIYFADSKYDAGWRNKTKEHLMY